MRDTALPVLLSFCMLCPSLAGGTGGAYFDLFHTRDMARDERQR